MNVGYLDLAELDWGVFDTKPVPVELHLVD